MQKIFNHHHLPSYIVLRPIIDDDESEAEMMVVEISLSPYTIQDYEDCGEDIIVKLPLAGPVANLVQEFVDTYFKPEKFVKRKRDKAKLDEQENRGGTSELKGTLVETPHSITQRYTFYCLFLDKIKLKIKLTKE